MSDSAVWSVAVFLVSAGVAAESYLAWLFIREWRDGRADEKARRASWRAECAPADGVGEAPAPVSHDASREIRRLRTFAGLAAVGLVTGIAAAQQPDAGSASTAEPSQPSASVEPAKVEAEPPASMADVGSAISVQLNLDFTNAYFYRGIRQQDKGLIVQPAARLTTRFVDEAALKLDGFIGTWNSVGPNAGTREDSLAEDWYESDVYAGFTLTRGKLSLTTSYTFLTSPSDAFQTVEELGFTLVLDDSEWLKAWALKPYATLALETGSNGSDGADLDNGAYLELGIAPSVSFDVGETPVTFTFPASVGLSLSEYYEDADGSDDTFGFAQVGAKASIPLGTSGRYGAWTLNAGASFLFLGDHAETFNRANDTEFVGTIGLQWNF